MIRKSARLVLALFCLTVLTVSFQNCSKPLFKSIEESQKTLRNENGGPYSGKPKEYRHFDPVQVCALDRNGKPLPSEVILIRAKPDGVLGAYLAREACRDQEPVLIADNEIQYIEATQELIYRNRTFSSQERPGDFDVVAASCPVGLSEIPGALRQNLVTATYDWNVLQTLQNDVWSKGWYHQPGIGVGLHSTLSSLPAFLIERNNPNYLEDWRRSSQHLNLQANTVYAFSFLAQAGSVPAADFTFYRGWTGVAGDARNEELILTFDFQNQSTQIVRNTNVSGVSAKITPVGNGYLCTVYFSTSATGDQTVSSVGVAPSLLNQSAAQVGDSILATAAQLVPVNQFCR